MGVVVFLRERRVEEALRGSAEGIRNPRFIDRKECDETIIFVLFCLLAGNATNLLGA